MGLGLGVLFAIALMVVPGALVGRLARLNWPTATAVGPALTYGVVALAIVPFGALGIGWNAWTALGTLAVVAVLAAGLRVLLDRYRDVAAEARSVPLRPAALVGAGVLAGALLIGAAALAGIPHWESIPSTWDTVWHANTVRYILDTGQASPTRMGDLRNVETHDLLYYPSAFHALAAVLSQLTGVSAAVACTLSSLAAAVWLFPVSAAVLTWRIVRPAAGWSVWRAAGAAGTAAGLAASFTAVPYVEFGTGAMPNLTAYGLAVPAFALVTAVPAHRDRIGVAVLGLVGVFSVHLTGGVIVVLLVAAWWLLEALRHPARGRLADVAALAGVGALSGLVLLPQFLGVLRQADIIAGHSFVTGLGKKRNLFDAVFQHTRHLNDFPVQETLIALALLGGLILVVKKIWWPVAVWLGLVTLIVYSSAPFGGPAGALLAHLSDLFYSDPRRLSAVVTLLLTPMAGIALFTVAALLVAGPLRARIGAAALAAATLTLVVVTVHSVAPIRGPLKVALSRFSELRHSLPPGVSTALTVLLAPVTVAVLAALAVLAAVSARWAVDRMSARPLSVPTGVRLTAALVLATTVALAWHYFPRHRLLFGQTYNSVMVDDNDLAAFACLAGLPGAKDTLIGNANTDGTAWMYAVAGLHPLWTHYDYPMQQGPGPNRYIFWAYADDADTDPRVAEAVRALNIRYVLISTPVVGGFVIPDGLESMDKSTSWAKIYDRGGVRIYEWHGRPAEAACGEAH